jgi:hypothetical protein
VSSLFRELLRLSLIPFSGGIDLSMFATIVEASIRNEFLTGSSGVESIETKDKQTSDRSGHSRRATAPN